MKYWTHPKQGKKKFKSNYERDSKGTRFLLLSSITGKSKVISFESWQAAKAMGWRKEK